MVIILYALVFSVLSFVAFNTSKKTKIKSLKYDAIAFATNVRTFLIYNNGNMNGKVYLKDIIEYDSSYNIISPFNSDTNCNPVDSYVKTVNNKTLVTLKCNNYLLSDYSLDEEKTNLYYVSNWQEEKPTNDDNYESIVLYNYKKNNKYALSNFMPLDMFFKEYMKQENVEVKTLNDIDNYEKKTLYRYKKTISS